MPMKRILVFDLDGTLIDTMADLADLFCEMLQREHDIAEELSRPLYIDLAGKGPRPQFEAVLSSVGRSDTGLIDDITERYWQVAETFEPVAFPETVEVLDQLRSNGYSMAVSSGGTTGSVLRKLRLTGIDRFFAAALGTDDGIRDMKKGPGHFDLIRKSLALGEGELEASGVFVGDAAYDMQVACDAGLLAVARLTGDNGEALRQAGAQHLIRDLREMDPLLSSL